MILTKEQREADNVAKMYYITLSDDDIIALTSLADEAEWAMDDYQYEADILHKLLSNLKTIGWQITEERRMAINELAGLLTDIGCPSCHRYLQKKHGNNVAVLKAMLEEAQP